MAPQPAVRRLTSPGPIRNLDIPTPPSGSRLTIPVPGAPSTQGRVNQLPTARLLVGAAEPKPKKKKDDSGLIGKLIGVPVGLVKGVAAGIKATPEFFGKAAQTVYGAGEDVLNTGLDLIDKDIFESRQEEDYRKATELGLTGYDRWAYSNQRNNPLFVAIAEGMQDTGGALLEPLSFGRFDYAEPGSEFARAWEEGKLGERLASDIGNVILAGRLGGAGNVVARAGQAVPGRTGRVISTTGRFIEEPIGTTTRGAARAVGVAAGAAEPRLAGTAARRASAFANRANLVAGSDRPLRSIFNQMQNMYQTRAKTKLDEAVQNRFAAEAQLATMPAGTEAEQTARAQKQAEIDKFTDQIEKRTRQQGKVAKGLRIAKYGELESERMRESIVDQARTVSTLGPLPESVETYTQRANSQEQLATAAEQAGDAVRAQEHRDAAITLRRSAELKAKYGEEAAQPTPPEIEQAAILEHIKASRVALQYEQAGVPLDQILLNIVDPRTTPLMEGRGMVPTEEGVRLAIEYRKYLDGAPNTLTELQIMYLDNVRAFLASLSDIADKLILTPGAIPEGLAPWIWTATYPNPAFLIDALKNYGKSAEVLDILDETTIGLLNAAVDQGVLPPTIFDELGLNPDNPAGSFTKLAKADVDTLEFRMAYQIIVGSFRRLKQGYGDLLGRPEIYPATMRKMVQMRQQQLRQATAEDVLEFATSAVQIADEFDDIIPKNVLDGLEADIQRALSPTERVVKSTWVRIKGRIETIQRIAAERAQKLRDLGDAITEEQRATLLRAIEAEQAIGAMATTAQMLADQPQLVGPKTRTVQTAEEMVAKQARLQTRARVLKNIAESRLARESRREASMPRRSVLSVRRVMTRAGRSIRNEIKALNRVIAGYDAAMSRADNDVLRAESELTDLENIREMVNDFTPDEIGFEVARFSDLLEQSQDSYGAAREFRSVEELMYEGRGATERFPEYYKLVLEAIQDMDSFDQLIELKKGYIDELKQRAAQYRAQEPARTAEVRRRRTALEQEGVAQFEDLADLLQVRIRALEEARDLAEQFAPELATELARQVDILKQTAKTSRNALGQGRLDEYLQILDQQINKIRRSLGARVRESEQVQTAALRGRLRGVAVIETAPGPARPEGGLVRTARLNKAAQTRMENTARALENRTARLVEKAQQTDVEARRQQSLADAAEIAAQLETRRSAIEDPSQLIGPELLAEGERPRYIPFGAPKGIGPEREFSMVMRGAGAAPQTTPQLARQRATGQVPMSLENVAARMNEVLGQLYRNTTVELILKDPELTMTAVDLVTPERLSQIEQEAAREVDAQKVVRDPNERRQVLKSVIGEKIMRDIRAKGYEPVSSVKVDPADGTHVAVGGLDRSVPADQVDGNTFVMRQGVAQRIAQRFEPVGATNTPAFLDSIGKFVTWGTGKFKANILPFSLRWQLGDAIGIVLMSSVRGDVPMGLLFEKWKQVTGDLRSPTDPRLAYLVFGDGLTAATANPMLATLRAYGLETRGMKNQNIGWLERFQERPTAAVADGNMRNPYNWIRVKAFRLNQFINVSGRLAFALTKLEEDLAAKGRSVDEITRPNSLNDPQLQDSIRRSVDLTNQALGAFSDLTPYERTVMRQVYPFWTWMKFINKAALDLALDQPDRVLMYANLGALSADPDNSGLADWLSGKTPVGGFLVDLNFMNPYADAIIFDGLNPLSASTETFTSVSPIISTPLTALGEVAYMSKGRQFPFLTIGSRPSYLEGTTSQYRTPGNVLGGIGYIGLKRLGGPFRNILNVLPEGEIPFTDVATGPVQRFSQGSLRTTGIESEPRLGPVAGRLSAIGASFGIPMPLIEQDLAIQQSEERARQERLAKRRKEREYKRAKR